MVDVSVIIPVWNDTDGLQLCLNALAVQTLPLTDFEVIVIDNGSSPPIKDGIESPDRLKIIWTREESPGSYAARNTGVAKASGTIFAFTDADCQPDPEWLQNGVDIVRGTETACYAAGRIDLIASGGGRLSPTDAFEAVANFNQERQIVEAGYAATANLFVRRKDFEKVGTFEELMSGGDYQWCRRAKSSGLTALYCNKAIIRHPARGSRKSVMQRELRMVGGHRDVNPGWKAALSYACRFALPPRRQIKDILALPSSSINGTNRLLAILFAIEIRLRIAANRLYLEWTGTASPRA